MLDSQGQQNDYIQNAPGVRLREGAGRRSGLPRLIFCGAEELKDDDPLLGGCNVNHGFLRLARRHVRRDSNGLFGSRTVREKNRESNHTTILKHDSWCCFKIKQVHKSIEDDDAAWSIKYEWQQPSVYISWNAQDLVTLVLCMDTPEELQKTIQCAWDEGFDKVQDPYQWYCLIVDKITDLYDESVWKLRDFVREDVEKRRSPESTNFERLHDIARHIIHSNETLEVALSTLDGMQQAHQLFSEEVSANEATTQDFSMRHTQLELSHLTRTIKASFLRSKSLHDRIHNEINLAYNLVNQRDSFLMKTIAVMTLVYLPGSYLASIFGMNFFDFSESSGLVLSNKFWIYWVLTAVMTVITVGTWIMWQSKSRHSRQPGATGQNRQTGSSTQSNTSACYLQATEKARERWHTKAKGDIASPV
ncbi:hypothetical protein B0J12DRAFT_93949 [Macrophomina phaseolina]|uniref:Mg2+ transporter protein CorA-like/Zinc transport protein ZntB n=1 Tax=Macrophomina phaseolina TaxID=35725 RepID=A0ABQ8GB49_9PEZI|nr:hypothetical protein B0J12DRAFT_93949 [Macrophomina phaseolina]